MISRNPFRAPRRAILLAFILFGFLVACVPSKHQLVLKEKEGFTLLLEGHKVAPLAQFESAATYDFFLVDHGGKQSLVRESFGGSKSTVVVFLDREATYSRAAYFSIDMVASAEAGVAQWAGIEIRFASPRDVNGQMWDDLLSEFEKYPPGSVWRERYRGAGAVIPTAVYASGAKLGEVAYVSASPELSRIEIDRLQRIGDF